MREELTLREFIEEVSKHEELMDMHVISLGGGTGGRYGCFNLIGLKDNDNNHRDLRIPFYKK
jgi:hypothetical protein